MTLKAVSFGCGVIGGRAVKLALKKKDIELVGAIDIANVGKDLGEVVGLDKKIGVIISDDVAGVFAKVQPDVVFHCTGSSLEKVYPEFEAIVKAGVKNTVSSCEELAYPYKKQPNLANELDKLAKSYGATLVGTGVNPGFLMDAWPLVMTGVCQDVQKIKAVRIQYATPRRAQFQHKIGAGKTVEEFNKLVEKKILRHVGLLESLAMIAAGLGWDIDDMRESIEPIISKAEFKTDFVTVNPGQAAGVKQVGRGFKDGNEVITLDFQAYIGAKESYDAVYIEGVPNMEVVVKGGVNGDIATAAMVVNTSVKAVAAPPGLLSMKDLSLVTVLPNK